MYTLLDHTADIGFEIDAPSQAEVFCEAMHALLACMFTDPPTCGLSTTNITRKADEIDLLLVAWIDELLFLIQTQASIPVSCSLQLTQDPDTAWRCDAHVLTTPYDPDAYGWIGEIKSATLHRLRFEKTPSGYQACVILDV